jgi:hypothetical protein
VFDVEEYQRLYPEWDGSLTLFESLRIVLVVVIFFVLPYVYIRFVEDRLKAALNHILVVINNYLHRY